MTLAPASAPLAQHPGVLLHDIARLFRQCFGHRLRDLGMSEPQWRALGTVNRFPGINQTQLAQLLGIGKAPLGKLIDRLEIDGLLARSPDSGDRRLKLLHISGAGEPVCRELVKRQVKFQASYLQGLSATRRSTLEHTLRVMYRNLSEQAGSDLCPADFESLSLIHLISGISRLNSRHFDQQLKQIGFTRSQWLVLITLDRREGCQQSELARELNMARAPLGVLVNELEAGEWVRREVDPDDRRARMLRLTGDCRKQLRRLGQHFEQLHTGSLAGVAARERQTLSASLTTIRDQLKVIAISDSNELREAQA